LGHYGLIGTFLVLGGRVLSITNGDEDWSTLESLGK
jgi:hypothetical protein